ncbi:ER lumen protein-retaining receptor [Chloropicon roscoffensis]|uniref:ER lumen protein-retaining receptor n=2 Tax=Chloropicon roscoffensis TaxID=1461544 RepID=A0AAX4PD65_9CHLO
MEPARRRNAAGGGFGGITRKTTDEVLNRMKGASRGQAALGALLFSAVFLALTFAVVEWIFGGAVDVVFIAMEIVHFFGILVLMRKLLKEKSCEGLSLRTQENTAAYLVARVISGALFEGNHHTLLDFLTLAVTALVIYFMNTSLKSTVDHKRDMSRRDQLLYIIAPCLGMAVLVNPAVKMHLGFVAWVCNVLWAFSTYLEAISVVPQLKVMKQIADQVGFFERKSTADYVFALGITRFLACASWIIQPSTFGYVIAVTFQGKLWAFLTLIAEIVQTFILADFCYYYVKSVADGSGLVQFSSVV